jgi:hypothetical protein
MAYDRFNADPQFDADTEFDADAPLDAYEHGYPDERASFSSWHVTAGLGAVTALAAVGIVWWAMATVSAWHLPTTAAKHVLPLEIDRGSAVASTSDPTTVVAKTDRAGATRAEPPDLRFSGWEADLDRTGMMFVLPENLSGDQTKARPNLAPQEANAAPPVADAAPEVDVPALPAARTFARHRRLASSEHDQPRAAAGSRLHKGFARGTYTEKVVEQGDAGEVKYRYVRRTCTPPHMVDVCYMPAENRRSVVVQRY